MRRPLNQKRQGRGKDQQSSEEVVDWVGKQRVWVYVNRRNLTINTIGLKLGHPNMHINKRLPTGQYCGGKAFILFLGNQQDGVPL